ncbi:MAG: YggT family protein [Bacillota bacterium]|uniref:YggT family protein n=1 Tax=Virgibacillus salarius TaxID=447199 RepID=A0A941I999_9BACI|nr:MULTISPECIES: YggT family protein [Bacillaceae]NAZ08033.1 YggT family protein [Agaribacter marinus]MBR7795318.1 YggT family protein [Virgibacillus salarius]MCC2249592.1 YggT family protein [Virgibacillus sp. AGTR]MDY7044172.1 YggT family protein [Virgibacillus sp. M23]QRZ16884.1 YggT family protein [Virgibacillus sp. AGTR]
MFGLYRLLDTAFVIYSYALIIYIFMSWFPGARESSFGQILAKVCEPYLEQFRKFIPPIGMIDLSPIVAIFVLYLARMGLLQFFQMFVF